VVDREPEGTFRRLADQSSGEVGGEKDVAGPGRIDIGQGGSRLAMDLAADR
jgi:hypothetical protein